MRTKKNSCVDRWSYTGCRSAAASRSPRAVHSCYARPPYTRKTAIPNRSFDGDGSMPPSIHAAQTPALDRALDRLAAAPTPSVESEIPCPSPPVCRVHTRLVVATIHISRYTCRESLLRPPSTYAISPSVRVRRPVTVETSDRAWSERHVTRTDDDVEPRRYRSVGRSLTKRVYHTSGFYSPIDDGLIATYRLVPFFIY